MEGEKVMYAHHSPDIFEQPFEQEDGSSPYVLDYNTPSMDSPEDWVSDYMPSKRPSNPVIVREHMHAAPVDQVGGFFSSFKRPDFILVTVLIIVIDIIFLASYIPGIYSPWYASLKSPIINVWVPRILWVVTTIISYFGLYVLWDDVTESDWHIYLTVSLLSGIGAMLTVAWSIALYQLQDIVLGTWMAAILFIYQFWMICYIWTIKKVAAILMIPLMLMYGYLFYSMINLAGLNGVLL